MRGNSVCRRPCRFANQKCSEGAASRSSSVGQRDEAVGQVVAHGAHEELGAPAREAAEHALPVRDRVRGPAAHSPSSCRISVSASASAMRVDRAARRRRRSRSRRAPTAARRRRACPPRFGPLPQPAPQRLQPHVDRAVARRGRGRRQVARVLAPGDEHAHAVAPFLALELAQEELRLAEASDAGAVDERAADQRAVDARRRRTGRSCAGVERERHVRRLFQRRPQRLALRHPGADLRLRHRRAERRVPRSQR